MIITIRCTNVAVSLDEVLSAIEKHVEKGPLDFSEFDALRLEAAANALRTRLNAYTTPAECQPRPHF